MVNFVLTNGHGGGQKTNFSTVVFPISTAFSSPSFLLQTPKLVGHYCLSSLPDKYRFVRHLNKSDHWSVALLPSSLKTPREWSSDDSCNDILEEEGERKHEQSNLSSENKGSTGWRRGKVKMRGRGRERESKSGKNECLHQLPHIGVTYWKGENPSDRASSVEILWEKTVFFINF